MALTVYTLEQAIKWDSIVHSFEEYDVYWLSGYVKAFQIHGDGEPLLFYYESECTRGINVVMKRDVSKDERFIGKIKEGDYYDFSTPYGYGGWIIEGDNYKDVFNAYNNWLKHNNIVSEFVRFHPMLKNHEYCRSFYEVIQLGQVVHMDLSSPDTIWNNMISKNRNMIRKAIKNDIRIYNGRFSEIFTVFQNIYNETMDRDNADKYYYFSPEFYTSIMNSLPYNSQVFWAEKDNTIIAASIMLSANGHINYHLSGSLWEYSSMAPTNLLLYETALWGYSNGYKSFYLGGGVGSAEDGLFKFKRSFYKGELNSFYIGKKIYDKEKYNELLRLRSVIDNKGFFPMYRG